MNDKARKRAHDIYNKVVEFLKQDLTGTLKINIKIWNGTITDSDHSFKQKIKFSDSEKE